MFSSHAPYSYGASCAVSSLPRQSSFGFSTARARAAHEHSRLLDLIRIHHGHQAHVSQNQ